jgi:NADH-quinone oxidoreductase subunit H
VRIGIGVALVLFIALFFLPASDDEESSTEEAEALRAGAFPTPTMPTGGPVRGAAAPLTFPTSSRLSTVAGEDS